MGKAASILFMTLVSASAAWALDPGMRARWREPMKLAAAELEAGRWDQALPRLETLTEDMVEVLEPGNRAAQLLGLVLVQRAVALAGLGRRDDALWYWQVAQGIDQAAVESDLTPYGEPGRFLQDNPLPPIGVDDQTATMESLAGEDFTPPVGIHRPQPVHPTGARASQVEGLLVVDFVIDAGGIPRRPRIRQALPAATLTYAGLEALRQWRFTPAMKAGKPVPIQFNVSLNFTLQRRR